jgi:hypothetical protein
MRDLSLLLTWPLALALALALLGECCNGCRMRCVCCVAEGL